MKKGSSYIIVILCMLITLMLSNLITLAYNKSIVQAARLRNSTLTSISKSGADVALVIFNDITQDIAESDAINALKNKIIYNGEFFIKGTDAVTYLERSLSDRLKNTYNDYFEYETKIDDRTFTTKLRTEFKTVGTRRRFNVKSSTSELGKRAVMTSNSTIELSVSNLRIVPKFKLKNINSYIPLIRTEGVPELMSEEFILYAEGEISPPFDKKIILSGSAGIRLLNVNITSGLIISEGPVELINSHFEGIILSNGLVNTNSTIITNEDVLSTLSFSSEDKQKLFFDTVGFSTLMDTTERNLSLVLKHIDLAPESHSTTTGVSLKISGRR